MSVVAPRLLDANALRRRLVRLYGEQADAALQMLMDRVHAFQVQLSAVPAAAAPWDQTDVVLITYADQVSSSSNDQRPLATLLEFFRQWQLAELINTVHFLPFFPYSSDDGFSVIDYRSIDPAVGDWSDVHRMGDECYLMFDFVMNHCSQGSQWFQDYLAGAEPFDRFFIEVDPAVDLSAVTRPRSLPLLHEFATSRGPRWVWTTFSQDQVDLNYAEPQLLAEVMQILLEYVSHGARIIRLDAIAYLWKEIGTSCIHLPQTHEVVKLLRQVLEAVAPQVLLLTETNVPHAENVSYFGDGDEAHMVYQFSLPPLLLDAFLHQDAGPLKRWLAGWESPPAGATYFNFTASHDGVGVRPLEGQVEIERLQSLVTKIKARGGRVSTRRQPDGSDSPYELNISYFDALADETGDSELQLRRFLTSQAMMLALQGMPAIYFHSLVGTPNDEAAVAASGIPRRINRHKYTLDELTAALDDSGSIQRQVFDGMRQLLRVRIAELAFHPQAEQRFVALDEPDVVAFERRAPSGERILVVANFAGDVVHIDPPAGYETATNLLGELSLASAQTWTLQPAEIAWMKGADADG